MSRQTLVAGTHNLTRLEDHPRVQIEDKALQCKPSRSHKMDTNLGPECPKKGHCHTVQLTVSSKEHRADGPDVRTPGCPCLVSHGRDSQLSSRPHPVFQRLNILPPPFLCVDLAVLELAL